MTKRATEYINDKIKVYFHVLLYEMCLAVCLNRLSRFWKCIQDILSELVPHLTLLHYSYSCQCYIKHADGFFFLLAMKIVCNPKDSVTFALLVHASSQEQNSSQGIQTVVNSLLLPASFKT